MQNTTWPSAIVWKLSLFYTSCAYYCPISIEIQDGRQNRLKIHIKNTMTFRYVRTKNIRV